jgi:hypothetical protein
MLFKFNDFKAINKSDSDEGDITLLNLKKRKGFSLYRTLFIFFTTLSIKKIGIVLLLILLSMFVLRNIPNISKKHLNHQKVLLHPLNELKDDKEDKKDKLKKPSVIVISSNSNYKSTLINFELNLLNNFESKVEFLFFRIIENDPFLVRISSSNSSVSPFPPSPQLPPIALPEALTALSTHLTHCDLILIDYLPPIHSLMTFLVEKTRNISMVYYLLDHHPMSPNPIFDSFLSCENARGNSLLSFTQFICSFSLLSSPFFTC